MIESANNERIKALAKLRERKGRLREGRFLLEGVLEIERARAGGLVFEEAYYCEHLLSEEEQTLLADLRAQGLSAEACSEKAFAKLAYREHPDGLVVVARCFERSLSALETRPGLYLLAVGIEKPGNLGALIRSAEAVGVDGLLLCEMSPDLANPNLIRASRGLVFTCRLASCSSEKACAFIRSCQVPLYATSPAAETLYWDAELSKGCALVVGAEHEGLPASWLEGADRCLKLPIAGEADSLNVAMTAVTMLYEAKRQMLRG